MEGIMDRSRRRELFWLCLIAGCVALFVARHERRAEAYDRSGMNELVRETQSEPATVPRRVRTNDALVTGSIALPIARPASRNEARQALNASGFYVPLGSYASIDQATRRYLDVARGDPLLERGNKLRIETVKVKGDGIFHRVRMGNFESAQSAKNACSRAGIAASLCLVVAAR
jgi:hypothetical protein